MLRDKSEFDFKVKINRDNTESYDGNIINGIKNGYGKVEYWTTRIEIGTFRDNKKHGYFKEYFDGNIRFEGQYVNGEKNGVGTEYNLCGKKMYQGIYKNDKKNGEVIEFDIDTSLIKGYGYYKDDNLYDGIRRSSDYDDVFLDYSELTNFEKERLFNEILDYDDIYWDKEALNELAEETGIINLEVKDVEWLINKFIESNYNEKSIYGRVIGWVFDDKTIMINRYNINVDVDEYSKGHSLMNSRFEIFEEFFNDKLCDRVSKNVKNMYFRENKIIEFTNNFIVGYTKDIFSSIDDFFINLVNIVILVSREENLNIYDHQIWCFENILEKISPNKKINFEEYYAVNYKNIENKIDLRLLMFLDNIEEKYKFETHGEAIISAFILLYIKTIEYYSKEFLEQINVKYEDILDYDLEQYIELYLKEIKNNNDSYNELMFIAFLIDKRKILRNMSIVEEMLQRKGIYKRTFEVNILEVYNEIKKLIYKDKKIKVLQRFGENISNMKLYSVDCIRDIDIMNGYEFEGFVCELFEFMGYSSEITKKSQDQGIDIIVNIKDKKVGIQAKCYSQSVGNKAIQEVVAGLAFHGLDKGMVITNSTFTKQAMQLARANNILLWDRYKLIDKINQINTFIIDN